MHGSDGVLSKTPDHIARQIATIQQYREAPTAPFDVAIIGNSEPGSDSLVGEFEDAGATWWLESIHELRAKPDQLLERVQTGP